jgi:hypothetical protein
MACCLLHRHKPRERGGVFGAVEAHESPLRCRETLVSPYSGRHAIWWTVSADPENDALPLLPFDVAENNGREGSARWRSDEEAAVAVSACERHPPLVEAARGLSQQTLDHTQIVAADGLRRWLRKHPGKES